MDKSASGSVDSRSREVTHEFDGQVGAFRRAFIKNGSNDGAGPENPEFVSRALIENRHATF